MYLQLKKTLIVKVPVNVLKCKLSRWCALRALSNSPNFWNLTLTNIPDRRHRSRFRKSHKSYYVPELSFMHLTVLSWLLISSRRGGRIGGGQWKGWTLWHKCCNVTLCTWSPYPPPNHGSYCTALPLPFSPSYSNLLPGSAQPGEGGVGPGPQD